MVSGTLKFLSLSDAYERKARFFPAVLTGMPLLPLFAMLGVAIDRWWAAVPSTVVFAAVVVGVSHLASAFGNRLQRKLYPRWPHDSPTNLWLHPENTERSAQRKAQWYEAIRKVCALDLSAVVGDRDEVERVIDDAVSKLRNKFWKAKEAERLDIHKTEYGFVRNLTGLRPVWLVFALASCAGCWGLYAARPDEPLAIPVVASVVLLVAVVAAVVLPEEVRDAAKRYSETFFATLEAVAKTTRTPPARDSGSKETKAAPKRTETDENS